MIRDRNTLYRDVGRRGIENGYTLRIVNKENEAHDYTLSVAGIEGIALESKSEFSVDAESVFTLPISVTAPHEYAIGGQKIEFRLESADGSGIAIVEESRFRGPTT